MFAKGITAKYTLVFLLTVQKLTTSSSLLYIVRQTCNRGTVFTPVPSTVSNICLQCVCVMSNISYCKTLIVQLSVVCSAALVINPATVATTAAPTTRIAPTNPVLTVPTVAPVVATPATSIGINPRASTPAASAMMNASPSSLMISASPMMMMIMAASANAAGGMSVNASATMTPVPAG